MIILKYILLMILGVIATWLGRVWANQSKLRVIDLEEIQYALSFFKSKIEYTYQPIPEVFQELAKICKPNIGAIFLRTCQNLKEQTVSEAWKNSVKTSAAQTNFSLEDQNILLDLSKMLGNTDLDGQMNLIDLTIALLQQQIKKAQKEVAQNEKLYRSLGAGLGIMIVIILI